MQNSSFQKCGLLLSKCEKTQCPSHMHKWWFSWLCHIYSCYFTAVDCSAYCTIPSNICAYNDFSRQQFLTIISEHYPLNFLPERPLMTDRKRNGFHGDPILVEEGPFCENVSRSASSLKLCLQRETGKRRKREKRLSFAQHLWLSNTLTNTLSTSLC